ncbi:MAG TPA: DNA gyrase inhibitor YacG [Steroidobacteraceae bacterium]
MRSRCVKCPTCQREVDWATAPYRPFCSERCRLIDLGAWLAENRAIAGDSPPEASGAEGNDPDTPEGP